MRLGQDKAKRIVEEAVETARRQGADTAYALLRTTDERLTRYSNDAIEMSTERFEPSLYLRTTYRNRPGAASINTFDHASLEWLAERARALAHSTTGSPADPPYLAPPVDSMPEVDCYDEATANMTAEGRARLVCQVQDVKQRWPRVKVYGNAVSGAEERAIANSEGLSAYFIGSVARLQVTTIAESGGAGLARYLGRSFDRLDTELLAAEALEKAGAFEEFTDIEPGDYEVILEPNATAEALFHLGYLGFDALSYMNGSSCFSDDLGKQVLAPQVTIWDDSLRSGQMCEPFDYEGVPRQRIRLVHNGTVENLVYDLATAAKANKESTGHGLEPEGAWFTDGPYARHLVLEPGESTREELISHVKRGLLITRFHYTRPLDQRKALLTGMTRDGTFLIEDGQVVGMLPNLRFTASAVDVLTNVVEIGADAQLATEYVHFNIAPSIRTTGFPITGKTG